MPDERREKPGPPKRLACLESLNGHNAIAGDKWCFKSNPPLIDQIEMIRFGTCLENLLPRSEVLESRTLSKQMRIALMEVFQKRVSGYDVFKGFHGTASFGVDEAEISDARMARTSSVMSMPTGHHVMQRPQPTQPDVPNWSIHVASL